MDIKTLQQNKNEQMTAAEQIKQTKTEHEMDNAEYKALGTTGNMQSIISQQQLDQKPKEESRCSFVLGPIQI